MIEKICEYCGNSVMKRPSEIKNSLHIFCNRKCFGLWLSEKKLRESDGRYVECSFCHKEIYKTGYELKSYTNFFCGHECHSNFKKLEDNKGKNHYLWDQVEVECIVCGTKIFRPKNRIDRNNKNFCSKKCKYDYQKESLIGEANPNYKGGLVKVKCSNCDCDLERKQCTVNKFDVYFCSPECRGEWISTNLKGENHPIYSKVDYECDWCGDTFKISKGKVDDGMKHFCSGACKDIWHSKNMSGEKSPLWKGTTPFIKAVRFGTEYRNWRKTCFVRDNYICQSCNKGSNKLVVHHKKPLIKIINNNQLTNMEEARNCEELWDINNGVTLCRKCHKLEHPKGYKDGGVE